jgi:hypothetical protein
MLRPTVPKQGSSDPRQSPVRGGQQHNHDKSQDDDSQARLSGGGTARLADVPVHPIHYVLPHTGVFLTYANLQYTPMRALMGSYVPFSRGFH